MSNATKFDPDKSYMMRWRRRDPLATRQSPQQYALYAELFDPLEYEKGLSWRRHARKSESKRFWGHTRTCILGILFIIFISSVVYPPLFAGFVWVIYGLIPSLRKSQDTAAFVALLVSIVPQGPDLLLEAPL